jgi:carboxylesterase
MEFLNDLAEDFYKSGGSEACLLIHGFTGSPAHMRYLAQSLNDEGYVVRGVRLPGHGTSLEEMETTDSDDWLTKVEEEYLSLKEKKDQVYVLGLSMGGVLSLLLAEKYDVDKIVPIAAPVKIQNKLAYLTPVLKYFKRFDRWPGTAEDDYDIGYSGMPVKSVPELLKLMRQAKQDLKQIDCPTLIVQSWGDETVEPISAEIIHDTISSNRKEILWLEESGHVCTVGPEKDKIHRQVIQFLAN